MAISWKICEATVEGGREIQGNHRKREEIYRERASDCACIICG